MGELNNIKNGKDILSMLIIQAGNPIIKEDSNGNFKAALDEKIFLTKNRLFPDKIFQRFFQPE